MSARLAYAQARMQARHGARLRPEDWRRLDAARSPARLIELARATALAPWAERVSAEMDPHALERALRAAWRGSVAEVAGWLPERWRAAALLLGETPELPLRDHLARGLPAPGWLDAEAAREERAPVGPRWLARWRAAWLQDAGGADAAALDALARRFFGPLDAPSGAARPPQARLEAAALRVFRRRAGAKPAVLAHLLLASLDFERFRGRLLERALFAAAERSPA